MEQFVFKKKTFFAVLAVLALVFSTALFAVATQKNNEVLAAPNKVLAAPIACVPIAGCPAGCQEVGGCWVESGYCGGFVDCICDGEHNMIPCDWWFM